MFWLLLSDQYTAFMFGLAAVSIALVMFMAHRSDVINHNYHLLHLSVKFPGYFFWLLKELVLSNIAVVKCIWLGSSSISPTVVMVKATQKTDIGKTIYANSITVTPGTVTIDLEGDQLTVHALQKEVAEGLKAGEMDRRITRLEK